MADGESANPGEFVMFTTNGEGWQHIGEWKSLPDQLLYHHKILKIFLGSNPKFNTNLNQLRRSTCVGIYDISSVSKT